MKKLAFVATPVWPNALHLFYNARNDEFKYTQFENIEAGIFYARRTGRN